MATYVNNLRLKEITTGDEDGTWGTSTNTNLELIGDALGYNTQDGFSTDADATTTVADGAADPARALYFKVTSSATLTATRTLTIGPNTVSRVMWIENATTGSQSINISQGSGANVTIASGATKVVYLDGAGAGAAVVDANANVPGGLNHIVEDTTPQLGGNLDAQGNDLNNIGAEDFDTTDKGSVGTGTVTFTVTDDTKQKLTVTGALTIAFSGWAASGAYQECEVELVNGGTNVTWPTINWVVGDGTTSTTFADTGITLATSGTNHVVVWSTNGGTTLYGVAA